jgi:hypothetical protein
MVNSKGGRHDTVAWPLTAALAGVLGLASLATTALAAVGIHGARVHLPGNVICLIAVVLVLPPLAAVGAARHGSSMRCLALPSIGGFFFLLGAAMPSFFIAATWICAVAAAETMWRKWRAPRHLCIGALFVWGAAVGIVYGLAGYAALDPQIILAHNSKPQDWDSIGTGLTILTVYVAGAFAGIAGGFVASIAGALLMAEPDDGPSEARPAA